MIITTIILSLCLIIFFLIPFLKIRINTLIDFTQQRVRVKNEVQQLPIVTEDAVINIFSNTDKMFINFWWSKLPILEQLDLALALCEITFPVWERYANGKEVFYQNAVTTKQNKINSKILHSAIEEITSLSQTQFPTKDNEKVKQYYGSFVNIVLAMQDAVWLPPYPVKKIFLAVYNILKSIVEQANFASATTFLCLAINHALDCIDITKIYSRLETDEFLEGYKNKIIQY
jgi:hypothetical protein